MFNILKVVIIAGVKLALAWDKAEDDGEHSGADTGFGA
jgi:hypothetical protein